MAKKITINWHGSDYTMEFNRKTVLGMESLGFEVSKISQKPNTMIPLLVQGSFAMHHPNMKPETAMDIFYDQSDKLGLITALSEMYSEPGEKLLEEPDDEAQAKNTTWVKGW